MNRRLNQKGFSPIIMIVLVAVLLIAGISTYAVLGRNTSTPLDARAAATLPSEIKTKEDVSKASAALDSTSIDKTIDPNQLDNDITSIF